LEYLVTAPRGWFFFFKAGYREIQEGPINY
jgi:hypothetical protein